ncbi:MAG: hypothetical protein K6G88_11900 [Lachnospiraceae bacterium]|nr:hypothetical protein [Lachnospiraceae bacterium]
MEVARDENGQLSIKYDEEETEIAENCLADYLAEYIKEQQVSEVNEKDTGTTENETELNNETSNKQ